MTTYAVTFLFNGRQQTITTFAETPDLPSLYAALREELRPLQDHETLVITDATPYSLEN